MSRAQLVDERSEEEVNDSNVDTLEAPEDPIESPEEEVAQEEPSVPEKYQNKSLQEVVQMHQEAEKLLGKQSSEVGELRKVVDDHIQTQLAQQQAPVQQQEEDDTDFFVDPQAAVSRAIENHPKIKEANEVTQNYKKQTALSQLQSKHPDMNTIVQDANFAEWIKSSKIRTQLFVQADQQYDYDAADELFSLWKERAAVAQQTVAVEKQARKQQVKSASTGNARGTGQGSRKKVYRRADIIKLMNTDPDRYAALSEEIFQAYADGRVK
jgi:hypothetical protein